MTCIKSVWSLQFWSFGSGLYIADNSSCLCDNALDRARGDWLGLETHLPILCTVWEKLCLSDPILCSTIIAQGQPVNSRTLDTTYAGKAIQALLTSSSGPSAGHISRSQHRGLSEGLLSNQSPQGCSHKAAQFSALCKLPGGKTNPLPFSTARGHVAMNKWDESLNWGSWLSLLLQRPLWRFWAIWIVSFICVLFVY